jgi:hypothetical protein
MAAMILSGTPWVWVLYPIALVPIPIFSLYFIASTFPMHKTVKSAKPSTANWFSSVGGSPTAGHANFTLMARAKPSKEPDPNSALSESNKE